MMLLMKRAIRTATTAQQTKERASNFRKHFFMCLSTARIVSPDFIAPPAARVLTKEGEIEPILRVRNGYCAVSTNDIHLV